ncbi:MULTISPECIES: hypothetical protein [Pseudonocardia]|uniref:Uncharacterized protein n=2 Tax=Pseudonocardia TaxID=1847 RepID=A0A1Y2MQV8_PSEAH|nr:MULTISPECIES: hypothetical protein [Pseudonocardia]OSY37582.1 hypothetical protein BG845_04619 [Pseudonocardia autotrophica]TDN73704.1 hypothetical protein C8E95_2808 [Pseudonocardia autotrophica]
MSAAPPQDRGHPPIDFPFSGVASWEGPTWVEFYEGGIGHPMTTLWLGHRVRDGRAHLSVGTHNQRLDGWRLEEDLAFDCLFVLSERMRPDSRAVQFPPGFNKVQIDHVHALSLDWQNWPTLPCTVDDSDAVMSYQRYAWGWAGFIAEVGVAGVKLVGVDVEPETVRLETVREPRRYGFDPTGRLSVDDLYDRRERGEDPRLPLPWSTTVHADHRALIEQHDLG